MTQMNTDTEWDMLYPLFDNVYQDRSRVTMDLMKNSST